MELKEISAERLTGIEKKIFFMAWLYELMRKGNIRPIPILAFESATELYTGGNYSYIDIDLISENIPSLAALLENNGFSRLGDRLCSIENELSVNFVTSHQCGRVGKVEYSGHAIFVVSIEDTIIEKLASAKFHNTPKDLEWAQVLFSSDGVLKPDPDYLEKRASKEGVSDLLGKISVAHKTIASEENHINPKTEEYPNICRKTHDRASSISHDSASRPIKFEDLQLITFEQRLKIPHRRELSSRPWSMDQLRVFMERQKTIPNLLARMGIEIADSIPYEEFKKKFARGSN